MWISFRTKAFSRGEGFRIIKRFLHCKTFLSDHTRQPLQPDRGKPCHYKQAMTFARSINERSISGPSFQIPNFKLQIESSRAEFLRPLTPPYVPFGIRRFNLISKYAD